MPEEKAPGSAVFAGTINQNGLLRVRATGVGADTTLARIIRKVEEAQDEKAPTQRFIERFARWYTPAILLMRRRWSSGESRNMSPHARTPSKVRSKNLESWTASQTTGVFGRLRSKAWTKDGAASTPNVLKAFGDQNLGNRKTGPAAQVDDSGSRW